jgi:GNAT superfamily N-acetyltransferase
VREVQHIAALDLGFARDDEEAAPARLDLSTYTYFLYVNSNQTIVGLLVTQSIAEAFVAATAQEDTGEKAANCGAGTARKAIMGVHLLWVHAKQRGKGIATRLLDVARDRLVFGYTALPPHQVAFSSPTEGGQRFAQAYLRKREATGPLLVYQQLATTQTRR